MAGFFRQRQENGECAAPAGGALTFDVAAMFGDDLLHERQAETRAFFFGGEKGHEQLLELLFGHALAVVGDAQLRPAAVAPGADGQLAAIGHRLPAVADEVQQGLP